MPSLCLELKVIGLAERTIKRVSLIAQLRVGRRAPVEWKLVQDSLRKLHPISIVS